MQYGKTGEKKEKKKKRKKKGKKIHRSVEGLNAKDK